MDSIRRSKSSFVFFFNDTATTEIYTLSLHDALPISAVTPVMPSRWTPPVTPTWPGQHSRRILRSEEHTSELQSRLHLVCRLLLEKKNNVDPSELHRLRSAVELHYERL